MEGFRWGCCIDCTRDVVLSPTSLLVLLIETLRLAAIPEILPNPIPTSLWDSLSRKKRRGSLRRVTRVIGTSSSLGINV